MESETLCYIVDFNSITSSSYHTFVKMKLVFLIFKVNIMNSTDSFMCFYVMLLWLIRVDIYEGHYHHCPKLCGNCTFPQNFRTRKLGEITVFYAVQMLTAGKSEWIDSIDTYRTGSHKVIILWSSGFRKIE